ncbi:protein-methionine-S-oxide reductase [Mrakia frigida]|uniref:peptide-methionine-S-sulfoxide reductase n=1 Tax=Mrakia frigida TaxID=29902 RepID=UPI003FCC033A
MLNKFVSLRTALFSLPLSQNFSSSPTCNMARIKNIPPPTVPTSIQSRENLSPVSALQEGIFAGGCFWGTEHEFTSHFGKLPSFKAVSGYTGGKATSTDPNYRQVCSGQTGHAEAVKVQFDASTVGYGELTEFFFRTHDPTSVDAQGPDKGTQYRSAIFTTTPEQYAIAQQVRDEVQEKYFTPKGKKIVTQIEKAGTWYDAEAYHQLYLDVNPDGYTCPTHKLYW